MGLFRIRIVGMFTCFALVVPLGAHGANNGSTWLSANDLAARPFESISSKERRIWFLYKAKPASQINDTIEFWNQRKKPVRVKIEAADAELSNGAFALRAPNNPGNFLNHWMRSTEQILTIEPGEKQIIPFSIDIPHDATSKDYWGGITVREIVDHGSAWRIGVRVLIQVRPGHSSATERLPQAGGKAVYHPEATLWVQWAFSQLSRLPALALFAE